MVYRHSVITRITHAVFFIAFAFLALSGAQIFLHAHWLHFKLTRWHEYAGVLMILCGVLYLTSAFVGGKWRALLFRAEDATGLWPMAAYYMRLRSAPPAYDEYNALQKLAYTVVLLLIGPIIAVTGLTLWAKIGGQNFGRVIVALHIGVALELVAFFCGHMIMVAATGFLNNLRSIVTGWWRAPGAPYAGASKGCVVEVSRGSVAAAVRGTVTEGSAAAAAPVN